MAKQEGDDLSDMLDQLAASQSGQEAQLNELAGLDAPAVPGTPATDDKEATSVEAAVEDSGEIAAAAGEAGPSDDVIAALAQEANETPDHAQTPEETVEALEEHAPPDFEEDTAPAALPTPHRHHHPPAKAAASAQAIFAPVLITFGVITLLPAIWSVLILMGVKTFMHSGKNVDGMAKLMLVCWPVAIGLLAGGIYSVVQVNRENAKKKKQAEEMAARTH